MNEQRLGKFKVYVNPRASYDLIREALRGCAVLHCEYLAHEVCYLYVVQHNDLEIVEPTELIPFYNPIYRTNMDGTGEQVYARESWGPRYASGS